MKPTALTETLLEERVDRTLGALPPREAYNLASDSYDEWSWQQFWRHNEVPVVLSLLGDLTPSSRVLEIGTGTGYYVGSTIA